MLNEKTAQEMLSNATDLLVSGIGSGLEIILVTGIASWGIFLTLRFFKNL
jgi:hypothetical protein